MTQQLLIMYIKFLAIQKFITSQLKVSIQN